MSTHEFARLAVTTDLGGSGITVGMHTITGERSGPTVTILGGLHGSEWLQIPVLKGLLQAVDGQELAGSLRIVPAANHLAFAHLTRNTPLDESDCPDLNRAFGGNRNTIADQIARTIFADVVEGSEVVIDLHFGIWGSAWYSVDWAGDLPDPALSARSRELAQAYGCPLVYQQRLSGFPGRGSVLWQAATTFGAVPLAVELGGCGFEPDLEASWIRENVEGLQSVLRYLGMLPGDPIQLDRYLHYRNFRRMEPAVGGYLIPQVDARELGREVEAGTVAAVVHDVQTMEPVDELRAPVSGVWRQVARPYPVRPGGWGFAVADLEEPGTGWGPAA